MRFPLSEAVRSIGVLAVKHAPHILNNSLDGGVSVGVSWGLHVTLLTSTVPELKAVPFQFKCPAVVHVEFMVDQVVWCRSFCANCNESNTTPFSRAPRGCMMGRQDAAASREWTAVCDFAGMNRNNLAKRRLITTRCWAPSGGEAYLWCEAHRMLGLNRKH